MLPPLDLKQFRSVLLMLQARIQSHVEHQEKHTFSIAESENHSSSNHMRIVENDQELISELVVALNRIDNRTFRVYEGCLKSGFAATGSTIPKSRLNTIPRARNCIHCERKREQGSSC